MSDQADGLRQLLRVRPGPELPPEPAHPSRPRVLLWTSGKGGVGTSNLVLNLAIALGRRGERVVLIDAAWGLANLDVLGGVTPMWDLGDVLIGRRTLMEAITPGPCGIRLIAGAHALRTPAAALADASARLADELPQLAPEADFILVDGGSGLDAGLRVLAGAADDVVVVTTPEPTALVDAHAALDRLWSPGVAEPALRVVVNQVRSRAEAADGLARVCAASREFLGLAVSPLGSVPADSHVGRAVRARRPFVVGAPHSPAARGVERLARDLRVESRPATGNRHGLAALAARWARGTAACW